MVSVETPKRRASTPVVSTERAISARTAGVVRAFGMDGVHQRLPAGFERPKRSKRQACSSSAKRT
jgi:hypothetical protein